MEAIQGSGYRRLHVAAAICMACSIALPAAAAHAQVDTHNTVSAPWIIVCERRPCVDNERATNTFFNMIYEQGRTWTGANPYFLSAKDWNSLTAVAAERQEIVAAHREKLAAELCEQSVALHTTAQLGAALEGSARASRELGAAYRSELEGKLSKEGQLLVDQVIHWLPDHVHTMDLDYAKYLTAASIERANFDQVLCSIAKAQGSAEEGFQQGAPKLAKPAVLPLAVFVAPECPATVNDIRDSAISAISRAGMSPLQWPALEETLSLAGIYVGLECGSDEPGVSVRLSLIEPREGDVELYDGYGTGDFYGGASAGVAAPKLDSGVDSAYITFMRAAVEQIVFRFLAMRFEL